MTELRALPRTDDVNDVNDDDLPEESEPPMATALFFSGGARGGGKTMHPPGFRARRKG
jgi:hypothetical protein